MAKSRGQREACFTFTNRSMKNGWEEKINNYNYKYFGRSTEGETVFDKNMDGSGMSQTCEDDKEQKVVNQRNIDNMIMR